MSQINISEDAKFNIQNLTRHAAVLGTTGSGKTVMCKVLVEEALLKKIPVIAIDPKGDIAGLGIHNEKFDFRPFVTGRKATSTAQKYYDELQYAPSLDYQTKIYTPKSNKGIPVSLMPDLSRPKHFENLDITEVANFVEPLSASITQLASISSNVEKVQSLISEIILTFWNNKEDLTIQKLIEFLINPPFQKIGSLDLEDFLKEKDRLKAAANLNLLLSSPSKKAWKEGETINVKDQFVKNNLSVFDLRFVHSQQEKQLVVEKILFEIYKFLLEKGGSEKLKYILYIDEIAGLLPPAPSNPPVKKILELLIRQARAFGLGIILATQNPGDIDYKILGNIGTRFIGKLRTENDMEKVATALDMAPSDLKQEIASLKTGMFVYNNSISNTKKTIKSRWLYTYHSGPLKDKEIAWVNNPSSRPFVKGEIVLKQIKQKITSVKTKKASKPKVVERKKAEKVDNKILQNLIKQVKNNSDETQIKIAMTKADVYIPHLRIVCEVKPFKSHKFPLRGPFTFDLTTKLIPVGNYLGRVTWSTYVPDNVVVERHKRNIKDTINYAIREVKVEVKTKFFISTITDAVNTDRDKVVEANHVYLKKMIKPRIQKLEDKKNKFVSMYEDRKKSNNKKIKEFKKKLFSTKTKRYIKKFLTKTNLAKKTREMKHWEKRVSQLESKNKEYDKRIKTHKNNFDKRVQKIKDQAFTKAKIHLKQKTFVPRHKDIKVMSTILLVPKKRNRL
ncbi:MAG: ATP-binding protein [Candidatus Woesearchaeota archaeon]